METSLYVFTQILTSAWSTVSIALCIIYIRCVHTLISLWAPFITWQTVLYTSPTPFRTISWNFCRIRINTLKYCIKYLIITWVKNRKMRIMIYSFSLFHLSVCLNWSSGNISFHRFQCNRHANHLHKSHDTPTWVSTRHNHGNILACRFCCFRIVDHFCKNPYHPTTCLSQSPRRSHLPMSLLQSWLGNKLGLKIIFYDFQIFSHFFI